MRGLLRWVFSRKTVPQEPDTPSRGTHSRSQSEVIGVVLLTAVVVLVVTVAGAIVLTNFQSDADDQGPRINVDSSLSNTSLTIRHQGGHTVPADEFNVLLEGERSYQISLDFFNKSTGSNQDATIADESFSPGTKWSYTFNETLSGSYDLRIVHPDSGRIVHENRFTLP